MLHAVIQARGWLPFVVLIACSDPAPFDGLLSASRISLAERETGRVYVAVDSLDDFTVEAPIGITIVPVADGIGPGFDVTATCDAARGMDADLVVRVHDSKGDRDAALVVAVTDDASEACAAAVTMWIEPCVAQPCDVACTPGSAPPATVFTLAKGELARVCVTAEALDASRPLAGETVAIEPSTSGFTGGVVSGTTRSVIVEGADWLVGPYQIHYSALAGSIPVNRIAPLDIGASTDIGIEVAAPAIPSPEFARTILPLTVHRFPTATPVCSVSIESMMSTAFECSPANAKLYDGNGASVPRCTELACGGQAHAPFMIGYVPEINSGTTATIPIRVSANSAAAYADISIDVASRAEDFSCGNASRIACADVDGDGALEVLATNEITGCLLTLQGWRQQAQTVPPRQNVRVLAIPRSARPEILSINSAGDVVRLARDTSPNTWTWVPFLTGKGVPEDAAPIRSGLTGAPDLLVGTVSGSPTQARFVSLDGAVTGQLSVGVDGAVVGAITAANGKQNLGVVAPGGSIAFEPRVSLIDLDWSSLPPKSNGSTVPASTGLSVGYQHAVVGRSAAGDDDVVVLSYSGPFASGLAELSGPPYDVTTSYGAVRSVAAAPDGSVLLGAAGGAQQTLSPAGLVSYRSIDPVPQPAPHQQYGQSIAPCFSATGGLAGFVVQTGNGAFRVAQIPITLESP